ncbi:MAG: peptidase U32 [Peptococcaceae bacterium]|nr:peptidase U32 [Peptococcaceae bacterium]
MARKPELLAPAGSWESLVAAVENGADAVYLGGKSFNARQSAGNFDNVELARAVEYAHIRGVKVYVTVNILLDDRELPEAARFLYFLQQAGADAAIVQDLGLVKLARQVVPELPLHASTQMTVHNLPTVLFLKEAGIARVVLARELALTAVENIIRRSGLAIEVFMHGALCVCYSGQCLMSSLIGGRSGNRGRCAQPCRLQYVLVDRQGKPLAEPRQVGSYLLSPRDLNLSEHVPGLIRAGISSFKIEGRMKRPEYVATVVRVYRELIDRALESGDYAVTPEEARELAQIFNRGFTTGYFYGRPGRDLMSYKRPNNRGVFLGRVKRFNRESGLVEIVLEEPLRAGDGIEVWVTEGGRSAGEVSRMYIAGKPVELAPAGTVVQLDVPGRVFPGDRVFKTHDAALMERARASFTSSRRQKKIPVVFTVTAKQGQPLLVEVEDDAGFAAAAQTEIPARAALNRPLTFAYLEKQLSRLGNTPFEMLGLKCRLDGQLMVPVSEINEARRKALAALANKRTAAVRQEPVPEHIFSRRLSESLAVETAAKPKAAGQPSLSVTVTDFECLKAAVTAGAGEVCFGMEQYRSRDRFSIDEIFKGSDFCARVGVSFVLASPRVIQDRDMDDYCRLLEKVSKCHLGGVMVTSPGLIRKVTEITGGPVLADFPLNIFNRAAASFLAGAGISRVALSPELTLEQISRLIPFLPVPAEVIVHGALPLMVSEYCAAGSLLGSGPPGCSSPCRGLSCGLKDRKGVVFPVEFDQFCRMHIFNSRDLCLIEDTGALAGAGAAVLRVEARRERAGYIRDVVRVYRTALDKFPTGNAADFTELKNILAKNSPQGFTKGHFYRGVI